MPVTIKDIARIAGVSHTTVSRALGTGSSVSGETVRRIRAVAREVGYIPNSAARSLKTSRSRVIGVLLRRLDDPYFSEVLHAFEEVAGAAGYSLFVAAARRNRERETEIVREMSRQRVEGVLICASDVSMEHRRGLEEFGVRTVLLNNQAPDLAGGAVCHDDFFGMVALTNHLLTLGHTRIGWIGNANAGSTSHDRWQGYQEALQRAGISPDPALTVEAPNGMAAGGVEGARQLLRLRNRPTAILAFNDMVALGAIHALNNLRLEVPRDCSVTGFDNIDIAACIHPPLTTFSQPRYELGRRAIAMLLAMIEGQETELPRTERLRGDLVVRDSTAPPPATLPTYL